MQTPAQQPCNLRSPADDSAARPVDIRRSACCEACSVEGVLFVNEDAIAASAPNDVAVLNGLLTSVSALVASKIHA